jgi:hypothetical protein
MTIETELSKKRLEVKNEITEGISKTPMAHLFHIPGRVIQKLTRYPKPIPFLFSMVILALIILILFGLNFLVLFRTTKTITQITPIATFTITEIFLLIVVLTYFNINRVLFSVRDTLVDFIMTSKDLSNLHEWLSLGWSLVTIGRFFFWWIVFFGGAIALLNLFLPQAGFSSPGLLLLYLFSLLLGGIAFYYAPLMILLPLRLRNYQFKLYENDPARSQIIEDLSSILNRYAYGYVFFNAILQSSFIILSLPIIAQLIFMITFGWIPVVIQYLINQACIRTIISLSKRKTLDRIQEEIQKLHEGDVKNKENIETINRLMDYHERIRVTPNSNLNMQVIGNFLNQLALPLLGFLLANIDTIINFFR